MKGDGPDQHGQESSSSSRPTQYGRVSAEDFDGDDNADLSLDNALLVDDLLEEGSGKAPYYPQAPTPVCLSLRSVG